MNLPIDPAGVEAPLISEAILARARSLPDRPALADTGSQMTYGELADAIERRAGVVRSLVEPGDRVVLAAANAVDQLIAHLAILRAGAVSVPLAGATPPERLRFIAGDCDARAICADTATHAAALAAVVGGQKVVSLAELRAFGDAGAPLAGPTHRKADDVACLMYTTGSTGDPKAVMLSHRSLGSALSHIIEYLGCSEADREAVVLPLSHSFGLGHAYCTLLSGGFLWVNDGLRPLKAALDALAGLGINAMPTTPSMLRLMLGAYRVPFLRSAAGLRRMVVNSERLPPEQAVEVLAAMPETDIVVYYGLTEASRSTFLRLRDEPPRRYSTVGKAAPRVDIAICDAHDSLLPHGSEGEVCIRGPHLAIGYWGHSDEEKAAFRNGWLHSGDLGTLDHDGYLTITGRLKDQINVGGLKISAAEIEAVLRRDSRIADVAVTGMPDPAGLRGETIAIAVVGRDQSLSADDVAAYCAQQLEVAAQPHRIAIVEAIPRAESGKVLKGDMLRVIAGAQGWTRA